MKPLSWKPVRRGDIYCAPACGGKCQYIAYLAATSLANKLAKVMGHGWKPHVWENMGWHNEVVNGSSCVNKFSNGLYTATIHVGRQFMAEDRYPRNAFMKALAKCDVQIETWKMEREVIAELS